MSNRVCTNFKDSVGNDLGCRFITKEDARDLIGGLLDNTDINSSVWGMGDNGAYQLSQGSDTTHKSSPVVLQAVTKQIIAVCGGLCQAHGLDRSGNLYSWGRNSYGQLGDGTTVEKSTPVNVSGTNTFKSFTAGRDFVLAIKNDGTLWSWGRGLCGALGSGAVTDRSTPVQVGALTCWKTVWASSAGYVSGGITEDGKLFRWGVNNTGQLGDGTTTNRSSPVQIGSGTDWKLLSSAHAIKTDGTLWAYGSGNCGRLGDGTTTNRSSPVQIGAGTDWKIATSTGSSTAAIKTNGTLWTWGRGICGELGDGTTVDRSSPVQVGSNTNWRQVKASRCTFIALKDDGTIWGWGKNQNGEIGDGTTTVYSSPVQITSHNDIYAISSGDSSLLFFREPNLFSRKRETGMKFNGVDLDECFVRREYFICSGAMSWGGSYAGALGDGTTVCKSSPVQLAKKGSIWKCISVGFNFQTGIQTDGTLWSWGCAASGRLGDGTTIDKSTPIQIGALQWSQISSGVFATVAIRCDGSLWAWGCNNVGQLGDGTTVNKSSPVQIGTLKDWVSVSYNFCSAMALKTNGTLWSWGCNSSGQLGDGTTTNRSSPVQVGTGTDWIKMNIAASIALAMKSDFSLWGWGKDANGVLMAGGAVNTCYSTPVQANGGSTLWREFCINGAGTFHGIKCDSSLWSIGDNSSGQLGDGTTVNKTTPVQISACGWKKVANTYKHVAALKTDGTLWTWGCNHVGQLGSGTTTSRSSPVQVGSNSNWTKISVFNNNTTALMEEC